MGVPPFLLMDGYLDRDRQAGKDFIKPGTEYYNEEQAKYKRPGEYYMPLYRTFMYESRQLSETNCAFFETQWFKCMEAFGTRLGTLYCDLEHRDLEECITFEKRLKRYHAVKDVRFKQWLRGERRHMYEPIEQYLATVLPHKAGMWNYVEEKKRRELDQQALQQ